MMHTQKAIAALGFCFYLYSIRIRISILDKKQNKTPQDTKTSNSWLSGVI